MFWGFCFHNNGYFILSFGQQKADMPSAFLISLLIFKQDGTQARRLCMLVPEVPEVELQSFITIAHRVNVRTAQSNKM